MGVKAAAARPNSTPSTPWDLRNRQTIGTSPDEKRRSQPPFEHGIQVGKGYSATTSWRPSYVGYTHVEEDGPERHLPQAQHVAASHQLQVVPHVGHHGLSVGRRCGWTQRRALVRQGGQGDAGEGGRGTHRSIAAVRGASAGNRAYPQALPVHLAPARDGVKPTHAQLYHPSWLRT